MSEIFNPLNSGHLLRVFLYLWVAKELIIITALYQYGYKKYKSSQIVKYIKGLFLSLSLFFAYLVLLPIVLILNKEIYLDIVNILPLLIIPVIYNLKKFRYYSVFEDEIKLPKEKNVKKIIKGRVD